MQKPVEELMQTKPDIKFLLLDCITASPLALSSSLFVLVFSQSVSPSGVKVAFCLVWTFVEQEDDVDGVAIDSDAKRSN